MPSHGVLQACCWTPSGTPDAFPEGAMDRPLMFDHASALAKCPLVEHERMGADLRRCSHPRSRRTTLGRRDEELASGYRWHGRDGCDGLYLREVLEQRPLAATSPSSAAPPSMAFAGVRARVYRRASRDALPESPRLFPAATHASHRAAIRHRAAIGHHAWLFPIATHASHRAAISHHAQRARHRHDDSHCRPWANRLFDLLAAACDAGETSRRCSIAYGRGRSPRRHRHPIGLRRHDHGRSRHGYERTSAAWSEESQE